MEQIAIHKVLAEFGLDLRKLVSWSSDGCTTMLGRTGGVARRLQHSSPSLVPFHCPAHRLDLAIQDIAGKVVTSYL